MREIYARNKRAAHDYTVLEKYEAGLVLKGSEVKSVKSKGCSIADAFVRVENGEAYMYGSFVPAFEKSGPFASEEKRARKLLLHSGEICELGRACAEKGLSIVPLSVYTDNGKVKVEIALCKGKKLYDKRAALKERDLARRAREAER